MADLDLLGTVGFLTVWIDGHGADLRARPTIASTALAEASQSEARDETIIFWDDVAADTLVETLPRPFT